MRRCRLRRRHPRKHLWSRSHRPLRGGSGDADLCRVLRAKATQHRARGRGRPTLGRASSKALDGVEAIFRERVLTLEAGPAVAEGQMDPATDDGVVPSGGQAFLEAMDASAAAPIILPQEPARQRRRCVPARAIRLRDKEKAHHAWNTLFAQSSPIRVTTADLSLNSSRVHRPAASVGRRTDLHVGRPKSTPGQRSREPWMQASAKQAARVSAKLPIRQLARV